MQRAAMIPALQYVLHETRASFKYADTTYMHSQW